MEPALKASTDTEDLDEFTQRQLKSLMKSPSIHSVSGSQDLFYSQASNCSRERNRNITDQLTRFIWVQCENPDCQKWRRISAENANQLTHEPWYCYMNSDPMTSTCEAPEEDYTHYDKLARKVGVKFVMSLLQVGSLVWAKTVGYCRWPGLITRDPITGVHVHIDVDGDPHSYHVEYLGNPHTHCWVSSANVELYGHKETSKFEMPKFNPKRKGRGRKQLQAGFVKQNRQTYRHVRVEEVMKEADYFLSMTLENRMKRIVFKYDPTADNDFNGDGDYNNMTNITNEDRCKSCRIKSGRKKARIKSSYLEDSLKQQKHSLAAGGERRLESKLIKKENHTWNGTCWTVQKMDGDCELPFQKCDSNMEHDLGFTVSPLSSPEQFSQSHLNISSSMINKTKEEKFSIDIQTYRKNERAFEHDVRRFMTRNNMRLRGARVWHKVPVTLFQLFSAVHERGGYKRVCDRKAWTSVYRELTHMWQATSGHIAKVFYERNLYPYELFINGKAFDKIHIERRQRGKSSTDHAEESKNLLPVSEDVQDVDDSRYQTDVINNDTTSCSFVVPQEPEDEVTDLEALLGELENDYNMLFQIENTSRLDASKKKLGIDITFHDESPANYFSPNVTYASTGSEFGQPDMPGCSQVQEVPGMDAFSESCDSSSQQQILHEMKALEDQVKAFHDEMEQLL